MSKPGVTFEVWVGSEEEAEALLEAINDKEADGEIQDVQVRRLD